MDFINREYTCYFPFLYNDMFFNLETLSLVLYEQRLEYMNFGVILLKNSNFLVINLLQDTSYSLFSNNLNAYVLAQ